MKKPFNLYPPKTKVYAISHYTENGQPIDHVAIYEAVISTAYVDWDKTIQDYKISYWLETPSGVSWGDAVDEGFVCEEFKPLINVMAEVWAKNANTTNKYINEVDDPLPIPCDDYEEDWGEEDWGEEDGGWECNTNCTGTTETFTTSSGNVY